jgi:TonB family protein
MTTLASNTPLPDPPARPPAGLEPLRLGAAKPLFVLTQDPQLVAALKKVTDPRHEVLESGAEIDLSSALIAHQAGVAVIDCAALTSPVAILTERLYMQFPELVLIVAGNIDEQGQLAARITDGTVHRFLHKPFSEQRVRLFVEAGWRRHAEMRAEPRRSPAAGAQRPRRLRTALVPVLTTLTVLAAAAAGYLLINARLSEHAAQTPAAAPATPAPPATPERDTRLDQLLLRAAQAMSTGALTAPPEGNARDLYREARELAPHDPRVSEGLAQLAVRLLDQADAALQAHHPDEAQRALEEARALAPNEPRIATLTAALAAYAARAAAAKDKARGSDARLADYLARARDAEARGALIEPAEDNAQVYIESAHALSPDDPAVAQAQEELRALLEQAARHALEGGNADEADKLAAAALDAGADPARVSALHEDAQQLRAQERSDAADKLVSAFNARLGEGHLLEPAGDSASSYLAQLVRSDPQSAATQQAKNAYRARVLDEARASLKAHDYPACQRWLGEARTAAADAAQIAALESDLKAAQAASQAAASYVAENTLTRTRYVAPDFPDAARARGIDGWVDLQFLVGADGVVSEVTVVGAQPAGLFEEAALDAVRRWRYQPVTRGGQNVAQHARVRVRFTVQR